MIYCTCHCWNPYLTSGGGLAVVEVMVMCLFFWTEAPCASLLHSQYPHMCYWCIHLQGNREKYSGFIRTLECVSQHNLYKLQQHLNEWMNELWMNYYKFNIIKLLKKVAKGIFCFHRKLTIIFIICICFFSWAIVCWGTKEQTERVQSWDLHLVGPHKYNHTPCLPMCRNCRSNCCKIKAYFDMHILPPQPDCNFHTN